MGIGIDPFGLKKKKILTNLRYGEKIILKLGEDEYIGWRKNLILTNKRLIFLKKDKIDSEIPIDEIAEVFPHLVWVRISTMKGLLRNGREPSMKIILKNGREVSIIFFCRGIKALKGALLGRSYLIPKQKSIINRWVNAINNLIHNH